MVRKNFSWLCGLFVLIQIPLVGMDNPPPAADPAAPPVAPVNPLDLDQQRQRLRDFMAAQVQNPQIQNIQVGDLRRAVQEPLQQLVQALQQRGINLDPAVQGVQQFIAQEAQEYGVDDQQGVANVAGRLRDALAAIDDPVLQAELQALNNRNHDDLNFFHGGRLGAMVEAGRGFLARQGQNPLLQRRIGDLIADGQDFLQNQVINNPQLAAAPFVGIVHDVNDVLHQIDQNPVLQNLALPLQAGLAQAGNVLDQIEQDPMAQIPAGMVIGLAAGPANQIAQGVLQNPIVAMIRPIVENINVADIPRHAANGIELGQNGFEMARDVQNRLNDAEVFLNDENRLVEYMRQGKNDAEWHLFKGTVIGDLLAASLELPAHEIDMLLDNGRRWEFGHWDDEANLYRHGRGYVHHPELERHMFADVTLKLNGYDALKVAFFALQIQIEKKLYTQFTDYCQDSLLSNFEQKRDGLIEAYNSIMQEHGSVDGETSLPLLKKAFLEQFAIKTDISRKPARMLLLFLVSEMIRQYCEELLVAPQGLGDVGLNFLKCCLQEGRFHRQRQAGYRDLGLEPVGAERRFQADIHPVHLGVSALRTFYFGQHRLGEFLQSIRPIVLEMVQGSYPEDHWYHYVIKYLRKVIGDEPLFTVDDAALAHIQDEVERDRERMRRESWDTKFLFSNAEKIFAWNRCFKEMVRCYQAPLLAKIDSNPEEFLSRVTQLAIAYNAEEMAVADNEMKDFIESIKDEQDSFRTWVKAKNLFYGQAIVLVEGILVLPAYIELVKKVGGLGYNFVKALAR